MGMFQLPHARGASLTFVLCTTLVLDCARATNIRSAPGFSGVQLENQPLLLLPVAVTDDFGDERTGIVLDRQSREDAAKLACRSAPEIRDDIKIVCFDDPSIADSAVVLREVSTEFARDAPISAERWHQIARVTGARFALLFRPEGVSGSLKVSPVPKPPLTQMTRVMFGPQWTDRPGEVDPRGSVKTTRTYTLSSELVDLRGGQIVRAGARSADASTTTQEAPNATFAPPSHHARSHGRFARQGLTRGAVSHDQVEDPNFGVVTSFTFKTHATQDLTNFSATIQFADMGKVLAAWQTWQAGVPDSIWSYLITTFFTAGTPLVTLSGVCVGTPADFMPYWNQFLTAAQMQPPTTVTVKSYRDTMMALCAGRTVSQCHLVGQTPDAQIQRATFASTSDLYDAALPPEGIQAFVQAIRRAVTAGIRGQILLDAMGGALGRVAPDATAFPHRRALFSAEYYQDTGMASPTWPNSMRTTMKPWTSGRAYVNYRDPLITDTSVYYGANYARLVRVKAKYAYGSRPWSTRCGPF